MILPKAFPKKRLRHTGHLRAKLNLWLRSSQFPLTGMAEITIVPCPTDLSSINLSKAFY